MAVSPFVLQKSRMKAWPVFILVVGTLLGLLSSCRTSAPELPKQKNLGTIFDTAYRPPAEGNPPLLKYLDENYARYHKTLAEPVSVVRWSEACSHWKLFFATNRGIEPAAANSHRLLTNNQVQQSVVYGWAETRIPGRKRGKDPALAGAKSPFSLLAGFHSPQETSSEHLAEILEAGQISTVEFLAGLNQQINQSTGKDLLLFVHGFNVNFDSAVIRTAQLGLDLPFNGALCCYSWPSQGGIKNYGADEKVNAESLAPFQSFLQSLIHGVSPETRIHVVVHSMGNRLVLQALHQLSQQPGPIQPIENVVLCAPDVGITDYQKWVPGVQKMSRRVSLYMGDSDTALLASKALHSEQRVGDAIPPTLVAGVETIDCSPVEISLMGHSYYGGNLEVLCDLFSLIKEDLSAEQRPWLKQKTHAGQTYWQFASQPTPVLFTWNFPPEKLAPAPLQQTSATTETPAIK